MIIQVTNITNKTNTSQLADNIVNNVLMAGAKSVMVTTNEKLYRPIEKALHDQNINTSFCETDEMDFVEVKEINVCW